ncbi:hypothetical protein ACFX4N_23455 [Priestia sp. YIM B13551]|uniref:hypothetical protein n=1 Tax=Priestia sp. YIM B13551 TaxID=3366306 RepID=UPI003670BC6E
MLNINEYLCPICNQGHITIITERTGPPGFRDTDYDITKQTCECITFHGEVISMAIMSYTDEKNIPKGICESCDEMEATIKYPTKSWVGEYKNICSSCFEIKMKELKEKQPK